MGRLTLAHADALRLAITASIVAGLLVLAPNGSTASALGPPAGSSPPAPPAAFGVPSGPGPPAGPSPVVGLWSAPRPLPLARPSGPAVQRRPEAGVGCRWEAPVDAPIVERFRPPADPFGPGGNRGIEYGTFGGEPVGAVADGRVDFVGPVGGRRWLVIAHTSGLRSTYGPLASTLVVRGQDVEAGAALGAAEAGLHLTARTADRYVDPEPLLEGRCGRARLVADGPSLLPPAAGRAVGERPSHSYTYRPQYPISPSTIYHLRPIRIHGLLAKRHRSPMR